MAENHVDEAAAAIRTRFGKRPRVGLILGTGLGNLVAEMAVEIELSYAGIPHFPRSTAMAHRGALLCGELAGAAVMVLAGRCHLYEGYSLAELMLPVRVLSAVGIELLIITNAAGGLNPRFVAGDVMVIDDHVDLMFSSRKGAPAGGEWRVADCTLGVEQNGSIRNLQSAIRKGFYDPSLIHSAIAAARRGNFLLQRGVYVGVTGPNYETRAEYRAFRRLGGDVVGMSTIPEVLCAAQLGIRVLALSSVTNVACPDAPQVVTPEEVVAIAGRAEPKVRYLVIEAIRGLA
jgi:purine-nucleoside phosphorylase